MDQQMINGIYELLETMKEAIAYLSVNEDVQIREDIAFGRKQIETLLETEANCPVGKRLETEVLSDRDWLQEMYRVLDDIEHPLVVQNYYDKEFMLLINYIWETGADMLVTNMKNRLEMMRKASESNYQNFVEYFSKFPLWGTFAPEQNDYTTFQLRAKELKQRSYEFLWLYKRLEDYTSKKTLYAIVLNWAMLDVFQIKKVKSPFADYFEPDVFQNNYGDVFVDVGAYTGDTILQYIKIYGENYTKIFAYEISAASCELLYQNTKNLHDVYVKQKGLGKECGIMAMEENPDISANKVVQCDTGEEHKTMVEIVALDEELSGETVNFIKMDIEGAEQEAILGCEKTIQKSHPKLAICTYHGYEDIWKIPCMIDKMNPEYKFFLRHYGGDLVPTEFVLLCN